MKKGRTRRFDSTIDAPPLVRIGRKRVVYHRADLDVWLRTHLERILLR